MNAKFDLYIGQCRGCLRGFQGRRHVLSAAMILAALFGSGMLLGTPALATDEAPPTARATVDKLMQNVLAVLRDPKSTKQDKEDKVRQLAYDNIDFNILGRMSLGPPWKKLTDDQRKEFVEELKKHLANTYIHAVDEYTDQDLPVTAGHAEDDGDWTVLTQIVAEKNGTRQKVAEVDYRLRKEDSGWKIIDITIENVSLAINSREQFKEIMNDGGFDRLLKLLREKNAEGK